MVSAILLLCLGTRQNSGPIRLYELDAAHELLRIVRRHCGVVAERVEVPEQKASQRTVYWLPNHHISSQYCRPWHGGLERRSGKSFELDLLPIQTHGLVRIVQSVANILPTKPFVIICKSRVEIKFFKSGSAAKILHITL